MFKAIRLIRSFPKISGSKNLKSGLVIGIFIYIWTQHLIWNADCKKSKITVLQLKKK